MIVTNQCLFIDFNGFIYLNMSKSYRKVLYSTILIYIMMKIYLKCFLLSIDLISIQILSITYLVMRIIKKVEDSCDLLINYEYLM